MMQTMYLIHEFYKYLEMFVSLCLTMFAMSLYLYWWFDSFLFEITKNRTTAKTKNTRKLARSQMDQLMQWFWCNETLNFIWIHQNSLSTVLVKKFTSTTFAYKRNRQNPAKCIIQMIILSKRFFFFFFIQLFHFFYVWILHKMLKHIKWMIAVGSTWLHESIKMHSTECISNNCWPYYFNYLIYSNNVKLINIIQHSDSIYFRVIIPLKNSTNFNDTVLLVWIVTILNILIILFQFNRWRCWRTYTYIILFI